MSYVTSASVTRRSWRLGKLGQSIRSSANQVASALADNQPKAVPLLNLGKRAWRRPLLRRVHQSKGGTKYIYCLT